MHLDPLAGFVVGVTADRRSGEQIELLTRKGASVVHAPTIVTHPLGEEAGVVDATRDLIAHPPEVTVLTTALGIRGWFEVAEAHDLADPLLDALSRSELYARGKKANGAAVTAGLERGWQAAIGTSAELIAALAATDLAGVRVAVQLDGAGSTAVLDALRAAGAEVVPVPVYRWTMPADTSPIERLITAVVERRVHAVTFTAAPQVENLVAVADSMGQRRALGEAFTTAVVPVCVGPVCADAAIAAGFGVPIAPERFRLGSMVLALASAFAARGIELTLAGTPIRIQGQMVATPSAQIQLTEREAELLHALAARFGAVVSKPQLLERVWGGSESDEHVVEVTVARLRNRLGSVGLGIETVVRRGYRLSAT